MQQTPHFNSGYSLIMLVVQRYINEQDVVREVLMALQGRKNIMMNWSQDDEGQSSFVVCGSQWTSDHD